MNKILYLLKKKIYSLLKKNRPYNIKKINLFLQLIEKSRKVKMKFKKKLKKSKKIKSI